MHLMRIGPCHFSLGFKLIYWAEKKPERFLSNWPQKSISFPANTQRSANGDGGQWRFPTQALGIPWGKVESSYLCCLKVWNQENRGEDIFPSMSEKKGFPDKTKRWDVNTNKKSVNWRSCRRICPGWPCFGLTRSFVSLRVTWSSRICFALQPLQSIFF